MPKARTLGSVTAEGTCDCGSPVVASGDPNGTVTAKGVGAVAKPKKISRRPKGPGPGEHCVFSIKSGKPLRCFSKKRSAENVARGFGSKFRVGTRNEIDD